MSKHYQDPDPLHGHGKAIPKPNTYKNPPRETSAFAPTEKPESKEEVERIRPRGSMLGIAALMAATIGMGGRR